MRFFIAALLFAFLLTPPAFAVEKESAYDRVLKTGTLRCAYGVWEPGVMRDPNTGKFSGLIYDLVQEMGKALNLKIEYNLEVDWASIHTALQAGKADAHCAGVWATPARGRQLAFSDPISFLPAVAFVKAGDKRFDNNMDLVNSPDITIAIIDDDVSAEIAAQDYPKAKTFSIPQLSPVEGLMLAVATGKADITFDGPNRFEAFSRTNPGKIRMVPTPRPIRIFPNSIAVDIHEQELQDMLNTALHQMQDNGTFDRLKKNYGKQYPVDFLLPVERPYKWTPELWSVE